MSENEIRSTEEMQDTPVERKPKKAKNTDRGANKKRRRKRRFGVPVTLTALLMIVALVFGLVVGYMVGRKRSQDTVATLRTENEQLSDQLEGAIGEEVDVFTDELTPEAEAALNELSGEGMETVSEDDALIAALSSDVFGEEAEPEDNSGDAVVAEFKGGKITVAEAREAYTDYVSLMAFSGIDADPNSTETIGLVLTDLVRDAVLRKNAEKLGVKTDDPDWEERLREKVGKGADASDTDGEAYYGSLVETQKQAFSETADVYEFAQMNGDIIAYNPPGYRAMKVIKLALDDKTVYSVYEINERLLQLDPAGDAAQIAALTDELNILYTTAEARAKSIMEKLDAGAKFDDMIDQYGADENMKDEAFRKKGYSISAESPLWSADVRAAAMALEKPGDYTRPLRSGDGVYILQYIGDVPEGPVPYAEIRDRIEAQIGSDAQNNAYEAQVEAWMQEADPKYYPERML